MTECERHFGAYERYVPTLKRIHQHLFYAHEAADRLDCRGYDQEGYWEAMCGSVDLMSQFVSLAVTQLSGGKITLTGSLEDAQVTNKVTPDNSFDTANIGPCGMTITEVSNELLRIAGTLWSNNRLESAGMFNRLWMPSPEQICLSIQKPDTEVYYAPVLHLSPSWEAAFGPGEYDWENLEGEWTDPGESGKFGPQDVWGNIFNFKRRLTKDGEVMIVNGQVIEWNGAHTNPMTEGGKYGIADTLTLVSV